MQVFKTFFKIAKKYRGSTIMYILIFMSIVLTIAANKDNSSVEDFQTSTIDVAVFDHDNSALSKGLVKYLEGHQKLVTIEENSDSFKDNLYSRKVYTFLSFLKALVKILLILALSICWNPISFQVPWQASFLICK